MTNLKKIVFKIRKFKENISKEIPTTYYISTNYTYKNGCAYQLLNSNKYIVMLNLYVS